MRKNTDLICNCIALYDWDAEETDLRGWFIYMEKASQEIGVSWESIGLATSRKLIQFKNGKRKLEATNFSETTSIELLGGVTQAGTNDNWKIYSSLSGKKRECRNTTEFCFSDYLASFDKETLINFLKDLLRFGNFKYGICYQREFRYGPNLYASGALGSDDLPREEEKKIGEWQRQYTFDNGYRTGLLRDVYPFNIFVATHLIQKVGNTTLEAWIDADPTHGSLEKITDKHWLWSIDPDHIPAAQETLQEAGLLLCYKV